MFMQNVTVFKVPLWKNDYHRFCNSIRIYRLVRIRALAWTDIPGQTSVRAGDVALLSWREWWEEGWLTLCSFPKEKKAACLKIAHTGAADASFLKTLTTVPFSIHVGDLFLLHLHGTKATSVPIQRFPLIGVKISCLAQRLKHLFHVLSLTNHAWWTWFFLISCVEAWLFFISFAMEVCQLA